MKQPGVWQTPGSVLLEGGLLIPAESSVLLLPRDCYNGASAASVTRDSRAPAGAPDACMKQTFLQHLRTDEQDICVES